MLLHTVNKSPFEKTSLASCLRYACEGSAVLLIEDAVYAAMSGTVVEETIRDAMKSIRIYALGPDLAARGLDEAGIIDGIETVDYGGFVDLTVEYDKTQAWL